MRVAKPGFTGGASSVGQGLSIQDGIGYADVYKNNSIVARVWDDGSGGHFVKVLTMALIQV
ncbi:hypothetical protein [Halalkalibacter urbisdiaboli]|uniref:hypothetical protein n=1 Tax=Halalkalibacter urbisdiaboli TaxID=1960589 RepID=UPI000B44FF37|nr:hypothetical protein [Halalkalibacter urbisdiaboli]